MAGQIRTLEKNEVELFRTLRLRAIDDVPEAFAETRKEARTRSMEEWRKLAAQVAGQPDSIMFIAEEKGNANGFVFGRIDPDDRMRGHIGSLWVDRTRGLRDTADALLESTIHWGRSRGLRSLILWVAEAAQIPARVYAEAGFRSTGQTIDVETESGIKMLEMELML